MRGAGHDTAPTGCHLGCGPLIAIDAIGADLGLTLGPGLILAVPTVIISGPVAALATVPLLNPVV